jgi:sugar phosphate isomerase/epimerase
MNGPEWTRDEKFSRVREAGFEHVECFFRDEATAAEIPPLLEKYGLRLAMGHRPSNVEDTLKTVELAARLKADWVLCQPASAFHTLEEVVAIIRAGSRAAADNGIPYFVETHRNNFTETIPQTLRLIEAVPEIKITADLSHFVVVGEFYGWDGEGALERMQPILDRAAHVHGRISNGEQVQVDVGDGSTDPARFFVKLWTYIFQNWRKTAQPGDIIPFSSELGPPRYAITLPDGREFSDRWTQSIVLKQLAEEAWAASA